MKKWTARALGHARNVRASGWIAVLAAVIGVAPLAARGDLVAPGVASWRCPADWVNCSEPRQSYFCYGARCDDYAQSRQAIRRELRFQELRQLPDAGTPARESITSQRRVDPTPASEIRPEYRGRSQVRPEFLRETKPPAAPL